MRHLTVGDLHLYDREMRSTKAMVKNSRVILEQLYAYLKDNKDIVLLNINGDIQHKTPTNKFNRKEIAYWRKMFRKIGTLMRGRFKKFNGYSLLGADDKTKKLFKKGLIAPIFTTKGNHDIDNEVGHTFYDDLIEEGLITNVKGLLVRHGKSQTCFLYRNYGTKERNVPKFKRDTDIIALEHDNLLHDESILWKVPNAEKKFLKAEDAVKGTDVTILSHIHDSVNPLKIETQEGISVLWQMGAIGRTSFNDEGKRNVGYGALMVFGDVENFKREEFELMPYQEYFSYKKMLRQKEYKNEFKDFDLKIEEQERITTDFREDINSFKEVEEDVKKFAIRVMEKVESRNTD